MRGSIGWLPVEQRLTLFGMGVCATATSLSLQQLAWLKTTIQREWASERMARALLSGRDPREAKTAEVTFSRLSKLLAEVAPGYDHKLFTGCHLAQDLLQRHSCNVDLCVIMAPRHYCLLVPEAD